MIISKQKNCYNNIEMKIEFEKKRKIGYKVLLRLKQRPIKTEVQFHTHSDCFLTLCFEAVHCVKSVHIQSFCGPYFPVFGLTTERYSVYLCIQSERGKTQTRKTPSTGTFRALVHYIKDTRIRENAGQRKPVFQHALRSGMLPDIYHRHFSNVLALIFRV